MTQFLTKPEGLPPWPELQGFRAVFAGRGVFQEMVPRGVRKFADYYDCEGHRTWKVGEFRRDLLYPIGAAHVYTVFYYTARRPNPNTLQ